MPSNAALASVPAAGAPPRQGQAGLRLAAQGALADVLHLADLAAVDLLALAMQQQAAIELGQGHAVRIWNPSGGRAPTLGWPARALQAAWPGAFGPAAPGLPRLAFVHGLAMLEAAARHGAAAPARHLIVLLRDEAERAMAEQRLAALGWAGEARIVNPRLVLRRDRAERPVWDVALSTTLLDAPPADAPRIGLSYAGRAPDAAELAFIARLRQATGLPVVALAEAADRRRLEAAGAETVPVAPRGAHWSAFFARATLLLLREGGLAQAALNDVAGHALRRARPVVALAAEPAAPGLLCFQEEAALFAWAAALAEPRRWQAAQAEAMAAARDALGEDYHLRRLEALLAAAGPPPALADAPPALVAPPPKAGAEAIAAFLAEAEGETLLDWLAQRPRLASVRRALQLLERRHVLWLLRLHERMEAHPAALATLDPALLFWLRLQVATVFSGIQCRDTALRMLEALEASPVRQTLTAEDTIQFELRRAQLRGRAGQRQERLDILHALVAAYPDEVGPRQQLGATLLPVAPEAALAELRAAAALAPELRLSLRLALAEALTVTGHAAEALPLLQPALERHGDNRALRLALANAHLGLGQREAWAAELATVLPRRGDAPALRISLDPDTPLLEALHPEPVAAAPETPQTPLVTVIMTAWNAAGTIGPAMRSVLAQTHTRLRLVVVDDASTDNTLEVVRGLAAQDPRILVLQQPRNGGTYAAKNRALSLLHSDYYTFHDSDDWMHPCRIERHVAHMRAHPEVVCSYSSWVRMESGGRAVAPPLENPASSFFGRGLLEENGYFDHVRASADGEFRWRLRRRYGPEAVPLLPDVLTIGLRHEGSLTTDGETGFDEYGYSAPRIAYAEAWVRWHRSVDDPDELYTPYPPCPRRFEAPREFLSEAVPHDHPFRHRPQGEAPPADAVVVQWPLGEEVLRNWGDKLNPELVGLLAQRPVAHAGDPKRPAGAPIHLVIGSNLASATPQKIVWGSGFIARKDRLLQRPQRICALRGPLSRAHVLATEPDCPEIYGDPALLYPLFYAPAIEPVYDIGLIQHCREAGEVPLPRLRPGLSVRLIDINGGLQEVVDAILSCRRILSSSLHGLIASHAYGVPATWLRFSDRLKGDGFKFHDYWASMGRDAVEPVEVRPGDLLDDAAGVSTPGRVLVDLYALLRACPFIDTARQEELVRLAEARRGAMRPHSILNIHAGLAAPAAG
ncbi:glycosyltransferase [Pseudoroseomonas cervicalis]|uniref:glycosyltransferase n=1 Tax=Teichococcus cervicalis TaxID=204525 RepID=UPI0022F19500|nr:glycosyltransferase [Pseudoroseomonas cervicalis]WBV44043.1 glycosyltransferase [Pseudoroseomonas cervicalis]